MSRIYHPLLALIASATESELAKYVEYLKEENKILRVRIPGQIHTRVSERLRLLAVGKVLGKAIEELITIVSPASFYRWVREESEGKMKTKKSKGARRKPQEIRDLVVEIAKLTGFGLTRIIGELRKMGIKKMSRATVRSILTEAGIDPPPDRNNDRWKNFIERHANTLWAVDFFSVRTVTTLGFQQMYVLVWICMTSREIIVSESTKHPNAAWVEEQAERFLDQTANRDPDEKPAIVLHDNDTKFCKDFTDKLKSRGVKPNALPVASPNLNGRCERVILTIKSECLAKFILFGKRHLDHVLGEFTDYYNTVRSSMVRDHLPPVRDGEPEEIETINLSQVRVNSHVGGLVKSFARKAA